MSISSKIHFLTFHDHRLKPEARRLRRQAESMRLFTTITVMTEKDLAKEFWDRYGKFLEIGSRGFGYWSWKPQAVLQCLEELEDNDILFYCDVGCSLNPLGRKIFLDYISNVSSTPSGFLVFKWAALTAAHCKGDLLDHFGVRDNDAITQTEEVIATAFFIRKSAETMAAVKKWNSAVTEDFSLINDAPSRSPNLDGFMEHRHDQAAFSIVAKEIKAYAVPSDLLFPPYTCSPTGEVVRAFDDKYPIHAKKGALNFKPRGIWSWLGKILIYLLPFGLVRKRQIQYLRMKRAWRAIRILEDLSPDVIDLMAPRDLSTLNSLSSNYRVQSITQSLQLAEEFRSLFATVLRPVSVVGGEKKRIGGERNGVVMVEPIPTGTVYSLGSGHYKEWEAEMAKGGRKVKFFSNTPPGKMTDVPYGIEVGEMSCHPALGLQAPLQSIFPNVVNTQSESNCILRIAVGGSDWEAFYVYGVEWDVLNGLSDEQIACFKQIVVEVHGLNPFELTYLHRKNILCRLNRTHALIHIHCKNNNVSNAFLPGLVPYPRAIELSYLRRDDHIFTENTEFFPTSLDRPSAPDMVEVIIGRFRDFDSHVENTGKSEQNQ